MLETFNICLKHKHEDTDKTVKTLIRKDLLVMLQTSKFLLTTYILPVQIGSTPFKTGVEPDDLTI